MLTRADIARSLATDEVRLAVAVRRGSPHAAEIAERIFDRYVAEAERRYAELAPVRP